MCIYHVYNLSPDSHRPQFVLLQCPLKFVEIYAKLRQTFTNSPTLYIPFIKNNSTKLSLFTLYPSGINVLGTAQR